MPLSPEDSQFLTNLQQRILANTAAGKGAHEGITAEDLKAALDKLRGDRGKALAAGAEKAGKAKPGRKAKEPAKNTSGKTLDEILAARGVNLD
jgi:hypothetical protein